MKVNPYLNFAGNAREAMEFYKSVFGGEFSSVVTFGDMPMEGVTIPEADAGKMMHISLPLGEDNVLMASDTLESLGHQFVVGNNVYVSLHPDSREEADRIFNGLSQGADVEMPMGDQVWGDYFGSLKDKFGVRWMLNYSTQQQG
ncbi:MAG TPA: VOC family protein [Actinomycetota bacterium]|nr:VOC family protein [Actinomycetota bacterium]